MFVRLNGQFDSCSQPALRDAFRWIENPVTIDLGNAWLGAAALAEVVCLTRRLGQRNVTLANPSLMMRRLIVDTRMDRLLQMVLASQSAPNSYPGPKCIVRVLGHKP